MAHDIRMSNPKGFQPERVDTTTRIEMVGGGLLGWNWFQWIDQEHLLRTDEQNKLVSELQAIAADVE
jgi:hypothetical protein